MKTQLDAASTAEEILDGVDLRGKTALTAGTSAGLGIESARVMIARGARVIGTARDLTKARHATRTF